MFELTTKLRNWIIYETSLEKIITKRKRPEQRWASEQKPNDILKETSADKDVLEV